MWTGPADGCPSPLIHPVLCVLAALARRASDNSSKQPAEGDPNKKKSTRKAKAGIKVPGRDRDGTGTETDTCVSLRRLTQGVEHATVSAPDSGSDKKKRTRYLSQCVKSLL